MSLSEKSYFPNIKRSHDTGVHAHEQTTSVVEIDGLAFEFALWSGDVNQFPKKADPRDERGSDGGKAVCVPLSGGLFKVSKQCCCKLEAVRSRIDPLGLRRGSVMQVLRLSRHIDSNAHHGVHLWTR